MSHERLPVSRSIQVILFDLDGVLVDATEWHYEALNRALSLFGFSINRYEHLSSYNGMPTRKKLEMLSLEKGLPTGLHELIARLKQIYTREEILTQCRPVFDKEYMLSRLRREGYRLGVCSNAVQESVELMLTQAGLFGYFDLILSNAHVERPKPDPQIYQKALSFFECRPEEVLAVEDGRHGIQAAQAAGLAVCKVADFHKVNYFFVREALDKWSPAEVPA